MIEKYYLRITNDKRAFYLMADVTQEDHVYLIDSLHEEDYSIEKCSEEEALKSIEEDLLMWVSSPVDGDDYRFSDAVDDMVNEMYMMTATSFSFNMEHWSDITL